MSEYENFYLVLKRKFGGNPFGVSQLGELKPLRALMAVKKIPSLNIYIKNAIVCRVMKHVVSNGQEQQLQLNLNWKPVPKKWFEFVDSEKVVLECFSFRKMTARDGVSNNFFEI